MDSHNALLAVIELVPVVTGRIVSVNVLVAFNMLLVVDPGESVVVVGVTVVLEICVSREVLFVGGIVVFVVGVCVVVVEYCVVVVGVRVVVEDIREVVADLVVEVVVGIVVVVATLEDDPPPQTLQPVIVEP